MRDTKSVHFLAEREPQNIEVFFKNADGQYSGMSLPDQHHVELNLASAAKRGLVQVDESEYRQAMAKQEKEKLERDQSNLEAQNAVLDLPTPSEKRARENFSTAESMWIQSMMTSVAPGTTPLANAYSKLRMAQRRRAELNWVLWAYFVHTNYKVICKPDQSGTKHELYVEFKIKPDFLLWGNILAEFSQNLLSCLDQLMYALNTTEGGGVVDVGGEIPKSYKFPIQTIKDKIVGDDRSNFYFNGVGEPPRGVRNINEQVRQIIESVQPFNTHPDRPEDNPFEIIRKFSNIDKHREPLPIALRPQFDYFFQTGNAGVSQHGIEWFGRDYRGQPDGKIGHFTTPPEVVIQVEESIALQPCIEAVSHSAVNTFTHPRAEIIGSEMSLPQGLQEAVAKLLQDICNVMGWDEHLIRKGIPVNSSEEVLKRRWLPGVGPCQPFMPLSGFRKPNRNW